MAAEGGDHTSSRARLLQPRGCCCPGVGGAAHGARGLHFRLGLKILGGIAALLALIVLIGAETFRRHGFIFETHFATSVQRSHTRAQVRSRGVAIGTVREIAIAAALSTEARRGSIPWSEVAQLGAERFEFFRDRIVEKSLNQLRDPGDAGLWLRMARQGLTGLLDVEMDFLDTTGLAPQIPSWKAKRSVTAAVASTLAQSLSAAKQLMARLNKSTFPGWFSGLPPTWTHGRRA